MGQIAPDFAYKLVMQQPWAITQQALEALVETIRIRASGGFAEAEAAIPRSVPSAGRPRGGAIGVIRIRGTITQHVASDFFSFLFGGTSTEAISAQIDEFLKDDDVQSIVLDIDSNGGTVSGVPELHAKIMEARKTKSIVALANASMFSAAYWIGSAADQLYATPSGMVGSIGVIAIHQDFSKALEDEGIKTTIITAGKHKADGNPFEPLADETRGRVQGRVDEMYDMFIRDVAKGRGVPESTIRNGYGEGDVVTAKKAKALGMIDGIFTLDRTIGRAATLKPVVALPETEEDVEAVVNQDDLKAYRAFMFQQIQRDMASVGAASGG